MCLYLLSLTFDFLAESMPISPNFNCLFPFPHYYFMRLDRRTYMHFIRSVWSVLYLKLKACILTPLEGNSEGRMVNLQIVFIEYKVPVSITFCFALYSPGFQTQRMHICLLCINRSQQQTKTFHLLACTENILLLFFQISAVQCKLVHFFHCFFQISALIFIRARAYHNVQGIYIKRPGFNQSHIQRCYK